MNNGFIRDNHDNNIKRLTELYKKYGVDEKSLGWTKNKQAIRFAQMLDRFDIRNASILDVGCGFGDLLTYLDVKDPTGSFDYTGIDIMPEFITVAKEKNPGRVFLIQDLFDYKPEGLYKYVVGCGCFFSLDPQNEEASYSFIDSFINRSLELCSDDGAAVFHFLTDKVDFRSSENDFHISPEKILGIAYAHSRRVVLDNSVFPFEACLTIYKDDTFRKETTVFNSMYGADR